MPWSCHMINFPRKKNATTWGVKVPKEVRPLGFKGNSRWDFLEEVSVGDAADEEACLLFAQRPHPFLPLESDDKLGLTSKLWVAGFSFLFLRAEESLIWWEMNSAGRLWFRAEGGTDLCSSSALHFKPHAPIFKTGTDGWLQFHVCSHREKKTLWCPTFFGVVNHWGRHF